MAVIEKMIRLVGSKGECEMIGLFDSGASGAATMQKWRFKLDFEAEEVIIDPRVTRLRFMLRPDYWL